MSSAVATVQIDDERVRVTEWAFEPGTETGFHVHGMDYVVLPMTSGALTIVDADGNETVSELIAGVAYSSTSGVAHNVINRSNQKIVFVEVEHKS
ncbi:cupin domain-containing protein [Planktotalea sp.]|uniref:cupin domain-containing protein n=1 Tax=Planktotalea sp. TaxID=2029877 RepID=UPI003298CCB5